MEKSQGLSFVRVVAPLSSFVDLAYSEWESCGSSVGNGRLVGFKHQAVEAELTQADSRHPHPPETPCRGPFEICRLFVLLLCLITLPGYAQEGPAQTISPNDALSRFDDTSKDTNEANQNNEAQDEVPKRIFWIIPNFMTTNDEPENRGPLTTKQKYSIAWHQFADPSAHFGNLLQASISQAADGIPHYGQGWTAFGERSLALEGDQFTGSFLIYGVLPHLLHQDPRYFRMGAGSPLSRVGYAASRVLIGRKDDGRSAFNASQVFGQLGQAGMSFTYYPRQDRDARGLFVGWALNLVYTIGWNQLKEFSPDLGAYLKRRSHRRRDYAKCDPDPKFRSPMTHDQSCHF
jgi:hypothetical protein